MPISAEVPEPYAFTVDPLDFEARMAIAIEIHY
jgi:hypothetical protein